MAIKNNGLALKFARKQLTNDKTIVEIALNQNKKALQFVSKEFIEKNNDFI